MQPNPPFSSPLLSGTGLVSVPWSGYFTQRQAKNDKPWVPVITGLSGTFTVSGYWTVTERILVFSLRITPTGSITSTFGTTYLDLPFPSLADGSAYCFNATTKAAIGPVFIETDTTKAWLPAFTTSNTVSISGTVQIRG